jgi:hypothetical protein
MGLPGMAAYCLFVFSLLWKLWKTYKEVRPGKYRPGEAGDIVLLGFSIAAGIFATSLLGNAAVAPISAGVSLLYCGTLIGAAERKEFSASRA